MGTRSAPSACVTRVSALLRTWVEDGDAQEQKETGEYLIQVLDQDRPSERPLFPAALKGVTW